MFASPFHSQWHGTETWEEERVMLRTWVQRSFEEQLFIQGNRGYCINFTGNSSATNVLEPRTRALGVSSWLLPDFYDFNWWSFLIAFPFIILSSSSLFLSCSSAPYRNFEDEIFVRRVDCNTSFPEYVLEYVPFFERIFLFLSIFIFILWLFILLFGIESRFSDSESALVWTGDLIPVYCLIWSFW